MSTIKSLRFDDNVTVANDVSEDSDTDESDASTSSKSIRWAKQRRNSTALGLIKTKPLNTMHSDLINTRFLKVSEETEKSFASIICESAIYSAQRSLRKKTGSAIAESDSCDNLPPTPLSGSISPMQLRRDTFFFHQPWTPSDSGLNSQGSFTGPEPLPPIVYRHEGSGSHHSPSENPTTSSAEDFIQLHRSKEVLPPIIKIKGDSPSPRNTPDVINTDRAGDSSHPASPRGTRPVETWSDQLLDTARHILQEAVTGAKKTVMFSDTATNDVKPSTPLPPIKDDVKPSTPLPPIKASTPRKKSRIPSNEKMRIKPAPFQIHHTRETYKPYPHLSHLPQFPHNQHGVTPSKRQKGPRKPSEFKKMVCPRAADLKPNQVMVNSHYILGGYYNKLECSDFASWVPIENKRRQRTPRCTSSSYDHQADQPK